MALSAPELYARPAVAVGKISIGISRRANYDIMKYSSWVHRLRYPKCKTIGFREATGSLDTSWISAWAKTASRIIDFCLRAGDEEFLEVLMRVLEAELSYGETNGTISRYDGH
jgi:hypothetical protein